MKHEKSCGAVVLRRAAKDPETWLLLVIRHWHGGHLSFPKGHMEAGETEIMTAEREVREETALSITITHDFRTTVSYAPMPGVEKEVTYFLAFTEESRTHPQENEIADVFWIDVKDAARRLTHENDKRVLSEALAYCEHNLRVFNPS